MRTNNELTIKNPFRFYLYEVPNTYVRFAFSDKDVELRVDRDEAGWDEITEIVMLKDLPEINQMRMKPFLEAITEQYYLENSSIIDLQDCIATQEWAINPSDDTKLLNMLGNDNVGFPEKLTESLFTAIFINEKYAHVDDRVLTVDDIHSLEIVFTFSSDYATDEVEFLVQNIEFKHPEDIRLIVKDDDSYPNMVFIDESIFEYYFGIKGNFVRTLLSQEYLITPAMVLDYELYDRIKNKIEFVRYEAVTHF